MNTTSKIRNIVASLGFIAASVIGFSAGHQTGSNVTVVQSAKAANDDAEPAPSCKAGGVSCTGKNYGAECCSGKCVEDPETSHYYCNGSGE
jgi:hypothetical protein